MVLLVPGPIVTTGMHFFAQHSDPLLVLGTEKKFWSEFFFGRKKLWSEKTYCRGWKNWSEKQNCQKKDVGQIYFWLETEFWSKNLSGRNFF